MTATLITTESRIKAQLREQAALKAAVPAKVYRLESETMSAEFAVKGDMVTVTEKSHGRFSPTGSYYYGPVVKVMDRAAARVVWAKLRQGSYRRKQ